MKKQAVTILFLLFILSSSCFGQVYFQDDFSSTQWPPSGWTIEDNAFYWSHQLTEYAGGQKPELRFHWYEGAYVTRLISDEIDMTGIDEIRLEFKQALHNSENVTGYFVKIETRGNQPFWQTVWEETPVDSIPQEIKTLVINNDDLGYDNFQFCFYFYGFTEESGQWYIDDVILYKPVVHDAAIMSVMKNLQFLKGESYAPQILVMNKGLANDSFSAVLTVTDLENNVVFTDTKQVLNLPVLESAWVEFDPYLFEAWDQIYNFSYELVLAEDGDLSNNIKSQEITTFSTERELVLFEIGTYSG